MRIIFAIGAMLLLISPAWSQATPGQEAKRILEQISKSVVSGAVDKPITRTIISPAAQSPDLKFSSQSDLTSDKIDRYFNRGISHFLPWDNPVRSRQFLQNTGTKFIHWAHLLWGQSPPDWKTLSAEIDAVHNSTWGRDIVYEAGVMEAIYRGATDRAFIPDWLYKCMEELGINKTRKPGPNGPRYFSYENMFDRNAADWPPANIGRWSRDKDGKDDGSVPDITMVETQLWYAYLITEYIDAGFEGIMFGGLELTGVRDAAAGNECMYELSQFCKRLAASRAYRRAVFMSTHHYCVAYKGQLEPDSPKIFTHMTWPSRMFYSSKFNHGMETGLNATDDGQHRTAAELQMVIKKPPFDLPVLIEIDNYGPSAPTSPIACNPEGDDEITAYKKKPAWARAAFLRQYYHEFQTYTNKRGKSGRVHLLPSGERMGYLPYKEADGDEEVIKELFAEAAALPVVSTAASKQKTTAAKTSVKWKTYRDKKRGFALQYPADAKINDKSAAMTPKSPGSFWIEFSMKPKGKPSYTINVRRTTLDTQTDADSYASANDFLKSWERATINGISGFHTISSDTASKGIIHRALLVNGKLVWMLNLTDKSGDPQNTSGIFDRILRSLNVGGTEPVPVKD